MKACVVKKNGQLVINDIPMPVIGEFDCLVKIEVCGLCGTTDLHIIDGIQAHHPADWYPAVLGHEAVGTVVQTGSKVRNIKIGDRVTRPAAIWPGTSIDGIYSAWGGFAEYGIVRDRQAVVEQYPELKGDYMLDRQNVVDPSISAIEASVAISVAETASWLNNIGDVLGKNIVIAGVGMAGLTILMNAKLSGANKVVCLGRRREALDLAIKCGADGVINIADDVKASMLEICPQGVDCYIEATGSNDMFNLGLSLIKPYGTVAIYAAPVGYKYELNMKQSSGAFNVKLAPAEEHLMYGKVVEAIKNKLIDTSPFTSNIMYGLENLAVLVERQRRKEILKGYIVI